MIRTSVEHCVWTCLC